MSDPVDRLKEIQQRAIARTRDQVDQDIEAGRLPIRMSRGHEPTGSIVQYPSMLARLPLFKASKDRSKYDCSWDNPEILETAWGRIARVGPGLNQYDDETFLALTHLCRAQTIEGPRKAIAPAKHLHVVKTHQTAPDLGALIESWQYESVRVEAGSTTVRDVSRFLGDKICGNMLQMRRQSVNRLRNTRLVHFVVKGVRMAKPNSFVPSFVVDETGALRHDLEWDEGFFLYAGDPDIDGVFHITWTPAYTAMLSSYTAIDYEVYRSLRSNYAKMLFKFFSSVMSRDAHFAIGFDKLSAIIDFKIINDDYREMKRVVKDSFQQINSQQKKYELLLPEIGRGKVPQARAFGAAVSERNIQPLGK